MKKLLWFLGAVVVAFVVYIVWLLDYIFHRKYRKMKEEFDSEAEDLEEKEHLKSELFLENQQKGGDLEKPIRRKETYKKRILIVEDDEMVAQLVKEILEGEGLDTEIAVDGLEGLEKINQNKYEVIVSDCNMPRMKGDKLYLEVQKLSEDLAKRIIFISGSIDDFKRSTRNRLLPKPFSHEQLIEVVKDLLKSNT